MPAIRRLAFVVNESKSGAAALAGRLAIACKESGVEFSSTASFPVPDDHLDGFDACCVIGGDGTLLAVVQAAARAQVPVIGVNRGSLGFLTTFPPDEAATGFRAILAGEFRVDRRALLECRTEHGTTLALNDVLIKDDLPTRIAHLDVFADNELVAGFFCDGLIFSTPTGSTAYNLSAGGPLVHPAADVVALTPICPHTLSNRAVIFPETVHLRVENRQEESCLRVAVDGRTNQIICRHGPVEIVLSKTTMPLAVPMNYEHFRVVRSKLKWSGGVRYAG